MTGTHYLIFINYNSEKNIHMITNTSLIRTRAVLSIGKTWEKAQSIAFDFSKYISAECNYSVHKQEILTLFRL